MFWMVVFTAVWENSGEYWFSRPSELVSSRRDYQGAHPVCLLRDMSPRRRAFFSSEECSRLGEKGLA